MEYKIKKGHHYSWPLFKWTLSLIPTDFKRTLVFAVKFNDSCRYSIKGGKQYDCNKLYGMSEGYHHESSIRAGWHYDPTDDKIHLCYYAYEEGDNLERGLYRDICPIDFNTQYVVEMTTKRYDENPEYVQDTMRIYSSDGSMLIGRYEHWRRVKRTWHIGYYLLPYFGGTTKAPHDMEIEIVQIKKEVAKLNKC